MTTGLVGGWLAGAAYAVMVAILTVAALAGAGIGRDLDIAMSAGSLVLLAAFVWVGGMVCSVVGWFGIAALHASARVIAWLGIIILAAAVLLPFTSIGLSVGGMRGVASLGALVGVGFYAAHAIFWARHGTARGLARLAIVGAILAAVSGLVATVTMWSEPRGLEAILVIALFAGPTGGVLAHWGSGMAIGRERQTVRALQTFE